MKQDTSSLFAYSREVVNNTLKPGSCLAWAGKAQGIPPGHEALLHTDQKFTPTFWHTAGAPTTLKMTGYKPILSILQHFSPRN